MHPWMGYAVPLQTSPFQHNLQLHRKLTVLGAMWTTSMMLPPPLFFFFFLYLGGGAVIAAEETGNSSVAVPTIEESLPLPVEGEGGPLEAGLLPCIPAQPLVPSTSSVAPGGPTLPTTPTVSPTSTPHNGGNVNCTPPAPYVVKGIRPIPPSLQKYIDEMIRSVGPSKVSNEVFLLPFPKAEPVVVPIPTTPPPIPLDVAKVINEMERQRTSGLFPSQGHPKLHLIPAARSVVRRPGAAGRTGSGGGVVPMPAKTRATLASLETPQGDPSSRWLWSWFGLGDSGSSSENNKGVVPSSSLSPAGRFYRERVILKPAENPTEGESYYGCPFEFVDEAK